MFVGFACLFVLFNHRIILNHIEEVVGSLGPEYPVLLILLQNISLPECLHVPLALSLQVGFTHNMCLTQHFHKMNKLVGKKGSGAGIEPLKMER